MEKGPKGLDGKKGKDKENGVLMKCTLTFFVHLLFLFFFPFSIASLPS